MDSRVKPKNDTRKKCPRMTVPDRKTSPRGKNIKRAVENDSKKKRRGGRCEGLEQDRENGDNKIPAGDVRKKCPRGKVDSWGKPESDDEGEAAERVTVVSVCPREGNGEK